MRISDWSSDVCSSDLRKKRLVGFKLLLIKQRSPSLKLRRCKPPRMLTRWPTTPGLLRSRLIRSLVQPPSQMSRLRSEEHTSELQSLMRISYAVFCLKKKNTANSTNSSKSYYKSKT